MRGKKEVGRNWTSEYWRVSGMCSAQRTCANGSIQADGSCNMEICISTRNHNSKNNNSNANMQPTSLIAQGHVNIQAVLGGRKLLCSIDSCFLVWMLMQSIERNQAHQIQFITSGFVEIGDKF